MLSRYATPSLTTVVQHGLEIGERAAKMLIKKLDEEVEEETYSTEIVQTTLITRESTKNKR